MESILGKAANCPVLVGRKSALDAALQHIDRTRQGGGGSMRLSGEAGLGKSRLVAELRTYAIDHNVLVLEGHCFPTDIASPYAPLIDLLRAYFTVAPLPTLAAALQPVARELARRLPESVPAAAHELTVLAEEPEQAKRRLVAALTSFFTLQAAQQPVLVIVEDLHWGDDASLEFLVHLARFCAGRPLLALYTFRNDEPRPGFPWLTQLDRERLAAELPLTRLSQDEVGMMIRAVLAQDHPVRRNLLDTVDSLAEGNPFFVEELLTSLMATGGLYRTAQGWACKPDLELRVPRSLQGVVQQRTLLLSAPAKQLLDLAAVVGRRFDFALLHALTQYDEAAFLALIKELVAARLVAEVPPDQFAFGHALTRQAIYAGLLTRERQVLHRRIAEMIERTYADLLDWHVAELAYHFYEAGLWAKALVYGRRAVERARALYAPRAAIDHATRALEAAGRLAQPPPPELYRLRGQAHEQLGDFVQASADLEAALRVSAALGRRMEWEALLDLGKLWASRDYVQAGAHIRRALDLARIMGEPALLAHSLNRLGNWLLNVEQPLEARSHHAEALAIFEGLTDLSGVAGTHDLLGMACYLGGDLIAGTAHLLQAVEAFRALDDREGLASSLATLTMRGGAYQTSSMVAAASLGEAVRAGEEALALAGQISWRSGEAYAHIFTAFCLGASGAYTRALAAAQAGLAIAEAIEHRQWLTAANCALGALHLDLLALAEARQYLEQALAQARAIGSSHWIRCASGYLASTYVLLNQHSLAQELLDTELDPALPAETLGQRLGWCGRAELALAQGDVALALQCADRLVASTLNITPRTLGAVPRLGLLRAQALTLHGVSEADLASLEEAESLLEAAFQQASAQQARPMVWRIQVALGNLHGLRGQQSESERACAAARAVIEEVGAELRDPQLRGLFLRRAIAMLPRTERQARRRLTHRRIGGLTPRECDVAIQLARGKTNAQIAEALVISERTVEAHISNVLAKLDFTSRSQIVAWADRVGLLSDSEA